MCISSLRSKTKTWSILKSSVLIVLDPHSTTFSLLEFVCVKIYDKLICYLVLFCFVNFILKYAHTPKTIPASPIPTFVWMISTGNMLCLWEWLKHLDISFNCLSLLMSYSCSMMSVLWCIRSVQVRSTPPITVWVSFIIVRTCSETWVSAWLERWWAEVQC